MVTKGMVSVRYCLLTRCLIGAIAQLAFDDFSLLQAGALGELDINSKLLSH